jgi:hypothetical protein
MIAISESFAKEHVEKWVTAWNNHDLNAILSMYAQDIEFYSPKIKAVFPERASARITNKKDLDYYWSLALKKFPQIHFTPVEFTIKENKCLLQYVAAPDAKVEWSVIEKFEFGNNGLIVTSNVFYGVEEVKQ